MEIKKYILKPCRLIHALGRMGYLKWLPDKTFIKMVYRCDSGKKLNLDNPQLFTEKIQWLKLNDRKEIYKSYVDKLAVREIIKKKLGEAYLIPLLKVYETTNEIEWDELPDRFVMKCTHDSASTIICTDKKKLNRLEAMKKLDKCLSRDLFWYGREWAYKGVPRRIIVEKLLTTEGKIPDDYKVLCFNGVAREIEVHRDRFTQPKLQDYDRDWNCVKNDFEGYGAFNTVCKKPECLDAMLSLSETLSAGTYVARIDWFYVDGQLYFGEITLYESSGFFSGAYREWDKKMGQWIELPL